MSAHTVHLVGSALSDPYISFSAGLNGLAGPLHGLANQEVLVFITNLVKEMGSAEVSDEKLKDFVWKLLKSGRVIPGYGHAVLRKTDPRYVAQREFCLKHLPGMCDSFCLRRNVLMPHVHRMDRLPDVQTGVPDLQDRSADSAGNGKSQEPLAQRRRPLWCHPPGLDTCPLFFEPNLHKIPFLVKQYYGLKEMNYYTVLFGVSRALGVCASLIWDRALGLPVSLPFCGCCVSSDLTYKPSCRTDRTTQVHDDGRTAEVGGSHLSTSAVVVVCVQKTSNKQTNNKINPSPDFRTRITHTSTTLRAAKNRTPLIQRHSHFVGFERQTTST